MEQACVAPTSEARCESAAVSGTGDANCTGFACAATSGEGDARCEGPSPGCVTISGTGEADAGRVGVAASGTGVARGLVAVSGTGCAEGPVQADNCDSVGVEPTTDASAETLAASGTGNATCEGPACLAASGTGNSSGPIALSGTGRTQGDSRLSGCETAQTVRLTEACHPRRGSMDPSPCTPHPPIRITEEQGPQGFILGHEDATGEPIYRPGSGVVAGNGTAENPYVIEDLCLAPSSKGTRPAGHGPGGVTLRIENVTAHVVVRENVIDGHPTTIPTPGAETRPFQAVAVEDVANLTLTRNRIQASRTSGVSLVDTRDVTVRSNLVRSMHFDGIRTEETKATSLVGNTVVTEGFTEIESIDDESLRVQGNAIEGDRVGIDVSSPQDVVVTHNSIRAADGLGLDVSDTTEPLDATHNWWGGALRALRRRRRRLHGRGRRWGRRTHPPPRRTRLFRPVGELACTERRRKLI